MNMNVSDSNINKIQIFKVFIIFSLDNEINCIKLDVGTNTYTNKISAVLNYFMPYLTNIDDQIKNDDASNQIKQQI